MKKLIKENVQYINSYKNICEWQKSKIKNLEDEILRLKTILEGSEAVLRESTKEYMDEIISKTDQINELKNTIEKQEIKIMIDKMKNCYNCKNKTLPYCVTCEDCEKYDKWKLRED